MPSSRPENVQYALNEAMQKPLIFVDERTNAAGHLWDHLVDPNTALGRFAECFLRY